MNIDKMVMLVAGTMVLISVLLSVFHSLWWLWLTGFVGANLMQASLTGFCPMVMILKATGVKVGAAFK